MSVLLINPWIYDFKAYDLWLKPLGLLYLADFLFKSGHNIDFIDCLRDFLASDLPCTRAERVVQGTARLRKIDLPLPAGERVGVRGDSYGTGKYYYEEIEKPAVYKEIPRKYKRYGLPIDVFKEKLKTIEKPEIVLITCTMTYWYKGAFEAIKIVKEFFPDAPVVLGGIYANLCYEHAKKYSGADIIGSRVKLQGARKELKDVGADLCVRPISVKALKEHGKITTKLLIKNYRPAYYLYPNLEYACVLTSTGCPYNCTYCASKYLHEKFYQRNPDDAADEICGYAESGIKNIAFYDDALLFNKENHIDKILDKIIEKKIEINFHTPNGIHARFIDKNLAQLLKKSGFKTIRLGFETQDPSLQDKIGGKTTNKELGSAAKNLFDAGFKKDEVGAYIMIGMPGQNYDEVLKTVKFAKNLGIKIKLTQFSPIPHTKLGDEMLEEYCAAEGQAQDLPLLHNNTYWLYKSPYIKFAEIQKIIGLTK